MLGYLFTLVQAASLPEPVETDAAPAPDRPREDSRWVRLEQAILRALLPFPEARLAVSRAMDDVEPATSP
jgi:hypothetical protein